MRALSQFVMGSEQNSGGPGVVGDREKEAFNNTKQQWSYLKPSPHAPTTGMSSLAIVKWPVIGFWRLYGLDWTWCSPMMTHASPEWVAPRSQCAAIVPSFFVSPN